MIKPICNAESKRVHFKAKIVQTKFLEDVLKAISKEECAQYKSLAETIKKIPDNKEYLFLYLGCNELKVDENSMELYHKAGLYDKKDKKLIKKGVYAIGNKYTGSQEKIEVSDKGFTRVLIEPLMKIYKLGK